MPTSRTRTIVEIALTIALAAVLNLIKVWQLPQGGSVSLVMVPIIVLALLRGTGPGVIAGALYGCLDCLMNPALVSPGFDNAALRLGAIGVQFLLDYPIAFGVLGLAGLFSARWLACARDGRWAAGIWSAVLPGTLVALVARFAAHTLSGIVFFGSYAPAGTPVWLYSSAYNSFVFVSGVLVFAATAAVLPVLTRTVGERSPAEA